MTILYILLVFLLIPCTLPAVGGSSEDQDSKVEFTGSLLSYSGVCFGPGETYIQATSLIGRIEGFYDVHGELTPASNLHSYPLFITAQRGLIKNLDFQVTIPTNVNHNINGTRVLLGDIFVLLGFQIVESKTNAGFNFRMLLGESFPTGRYNNLNPELEGIDLSGTGAYETLVIFAANKIFFSKTKHPFDINGNLIFILPCNTQVRNQSLYGGGEGTRGTVAVGTSIIFNFAFQLALIKHWALCTDINCVSQGASQFFPAQDNNGPLAGTSSFYTVSITPGIEYVPSEKIGILTGVWLSIAGRNATSFANPYMSIYYYF